MALYLGGQKVKINLDGVVYCLNLFFNEPITDGVRLLSSNGYILKDLNGLFITIKEDK